ncbi:hypothetical protein, partial [Bifidobacterium longum]|uniref:hypothetical protein n=1 Tax=Bifidobacterium longum TaxID=216816 RepID=UPI0035635734
MNEHHPAYEYYQKREHRVMDTLTRAVERDGLADPRREARTALSMMNGIRVRLAQGSGIGRFSGRLECLCRLPVASTVVRNKAYRNFCGALDWFSLSVGGVGVSRGG